MTLRQLNILIDLKNKSETNRLREVAYEIMNKLNGENEESENIEEVESFSDLKS